MVSNRNPQRTISTRPSSPWLVDEHKLVSGLRNDNSAPSLPRRFTHGVGAGEPLAIFIVGTARADRAPLSHARHISDEAVQILRRAADVACFLMAVSAGVHSQRTYSELRLEERGEALLSAGAEPGRRHRPALIPYPRTPGLWASRCTQLGRLGNWRRVQGYPRTSRAALHTGPTA